jgi:hypothetical protein
MVAEAFDVGFSGKREGFDNTWLTVGLLIEMWMHIDHFKPPLVGTILVYCWVFLHWLTQKDPIKSAHWLPRVRHAHRASQMRCLIAVQRRGQASMYQLRDMPQLDVQETSIYMSFVA